MKTNQIVKSLTAVVALSCPGLAFAGGEGWGSGFAASMKQAAASKADLLVDFTGSDWCSWCIKLDKEVFSQESFTEGVKDKFVLVEVDSPRDKSKLSAETITQNTELVEKYAVRGYPTILLCDAEGKPYAKTGYREGGPVDYVKNLDNLRGNKQRRDDAFASAAKLKGVEKAKALISALEAMKLSDEMVSRFYPEIAAQIQAADPEDETGFAKNAAVKAKQAEFQADLMGFARNKDFDGAIGLINEALKEGGLSAQEAQKMILNKAMFYGQQQKFDEAILALDEAKAADPESRLNAGIDGMKMRLAQQKEKLAAPKHPAAVE